MATLADLKKEIIRLLGEQIQETDEEGQALEVIQSQSTDSDLLISAVNAALRHIPTRVWKQSIFEISEEGSVFDLPTDLIEVQAVFENESALFVPKMILRASGNMSVSAGNAWYPYPQGKITFINELAATGANVYYSAMWTELSAEDDVCEAPAYANTAIAFYGTAYCLARKASESGAIRQFAQRVDAGKPTDIPAQMLSDFFLKRFEYEINTLPRTEGAIR